MECWRVILGMGLNLSFERSGRLHATGLNKPGPDCQGGPLGLGELISLPAGDAAKLENGAKNRVNDFQAPAETIQ